ncbi:MAG: ABC transporter ATP-binding protein [Sneathiellaceae bacterium]
MELATQGLSVDLGGAAVLRDIDLVLRPGGLVGLIGPNGAGKSTLLRALLGLLRPKSGRVLLDGAEIGRLDRRLLARQAAYLPQGHQVHWPLEVARLVALGRLPHLAPFQRLGAADARAVGEAMARADIGHLARREATSLSGGERARAMLARALAGETPILLADEPVTSLDPYHQLQVMELLHGLAGEGRLVVAVLHDLILAGRFCDWLVLLDRGRLAADGPPAAVLAPEPLARVYGIEAVSGTAGGAGYVLPWRRVPAASAQARETEDRC